MLKSLISARVLIQGLLGFLIYWLAVKFHINILYIILFGSLLGIVFGKMFCRWICPVGFIMGLLFKLQKDEIHQKTYMYYKAGCPIAWVSGWLNKFSFLKIKNDKEKCIKCGKCDKVCYITSINSDFSLYKPKKEQPFTQYSCSRCLMCIKDCPTNSISVTLFN